jgi:hypothetical protein
VRSEAQMNLKKQETYNNWRNPPPTNYAQIDSSVLKLFTGEHPKAVQDWLPLAEGLFQADANYPLTSRDKKHRLMLKFEKWFGFKFNKKHYQLIR